MSKKSLEEITRDKVMSQHVSLTEIATMIYNIPKPTDNSNSLELLKVAFMLVRAKFNIIVGILNDPEMESNDLTNAIEELNDML